jgi:hypothetical protein
MLALSGRDMWWLKEIQIGCLEQSHPDWGENLGYSPTIKQELKRGWKPSRCRPFESRYGLSRFFFGGGIFGVFGCMI